MPEAQVVIKNGGQTPAYDVINVSRFAAERYPPPPAPNLIISDREFSAPARTGESLAPGANSISIAQQADCSRFQKRRPFASGTGIVYVYGEIRYRDAFGREHWTKCRLMMGGPVGLVAASWSHARKATRQPERERVPSARSSLR